MGHHHDDKDNEDDYYIGERHHGHIHTQEHHEHTREHHHGHTHTQEHHEHTREHHHDHTHMHEHSGEESHTRTVLQLIIAAAATAAAVIFRPAMTDNVRLIVFLVIYLFIGADVIKGAIHGIREGEIFGEEFLMVIASVGAFLIGEELEAVCVMLFYRIGELLQDFAVDRSRKSISALMDIRPDSARRITANGEEEISPEAVKPGEMIQIRPGEKIPLDGIVAEGNSMIDTSSVTGESVPRSVRPGDTVLSGCINTAGLLTVKVTKPYAESTASRILELVENAAERKSKSEKFITRFARIYTPVVCILAVLLAVVPILVFKQSAQVWIYRALTFLVISCPCALVLSVPLAFFAGIGAAGRNGILVKGSNDFDTLYHADTVVFDKTGTLTEGVFSVQEICTAAEDVTEDDILKLAAYAECNSGHPIAHSVMRAYHGNPEPIKLSRMQEIPGQGICVRINDKETLVGNEKLMQSHGVEYRKNEKPGTIVYVAFDQRYLGSIVISDKVKDDAETAIRQLHECGVRRIVMLTGDSADNAEAVGRSLGIDKIYAGLLPEDKVIRLEELIRFSGKGKSVIFAGDGVNDAPVLVRADAGVAMGALGSDAAIEAADVVIMDDRLTRLADAIRLAGRTMRISRQNIIFAIAVKVIVLVLGALGFASMWAAVFADVGVCLLCVLNSLRNLRKSIAKA